MKKMSLLLIIVLIGCDEGVGVKNVDGYANIVFFSKISEIFSGKNKILVLGNNRYKVQYRFFFDTEYWDVGNKIYNTDVTIDTKKCKLADLLMDTNILLKKGKKGETVSIAKENILSVNINDTDLHGNVYLREKYIYVSLAWVNLNIGFYSFINFSNNEKINILDPELIIGIGETGPL